MAIIPIPDCGKGLNRDIPPFELDLGFWNDATNFRFYNGSAEKVGGLAAVFTTPAVTPYYLIPYTTSTKRFIVECGIAKVYVDDGTTQTQITRYIEPQTITTLQAVGGSFGQVTTASPHGLTTGDKVTVEGALSAGFNTTDVTITVTSSTGFRYVPTSYPGVDATVPGAYYVTSSSATVDFTGAVDDRWSGGVLGGVLILGNPVDGIYRWNGDTALKLTKLGATTVKSDVTRVFKQYIIQLAPTVSGTKYPQRVRWSSAAEPGALPAAYVANDDNDAGEQDLSETPGSCIDCLPLGEVNIVYKQDSRFAMQQIGGEYVFRFSRMVGRDGLFARGCVVDTPKGHVFLTQNLDVKIHQGGEATSIADGRVRRWLIANIDSTNGTRAFVTTNPKFNEVWICFPESGQSTCTKVLIWNWENDTWGDRVVSGVTYGASGLLPTTIATDSRLILSTTTPRIALVDSGTTDFGSAITATLNRTGLHLGDRDTIKCIQRSRWNTDATAGATASIQHGSAMTADASPSYTSAATHTTGTTDYVNAMATNGRFVALNVSTTAATWAVRSIDLHVTGGAKR